MRRTFFLFATLALLENNVASAADDVDELLDEVEEPKEKRGLAAAPRTDHPAEPGSSPRDRPLGQTIQQGLINFI